MPPEFDPLKEFVTRAHAAGLPLVVSMNTFSEGHREVKKGPGYDHPEWQTVLYETQLQLRGSAPGSEPSGSSPACSSSQTFRTSSEAVPNATVRVTSDV